MFTQLPWLSQLSGSYRVTSLLPVSAAGPLSPLAVYFSFFSFIFSLHPALHTVYQPPYSFSVEEVLQLPRPGNGFPAVRCYANWIQLLSCAKKSEITDLFS
ncbi:hypothetical protein ILYODFUR_004804 [Ilyodon furcidens]|uniref:Uncharacterized protein n=1 Tax=Ilyodon furcidens TaxID=33524 RepID=A0ABV0TRX6_9TELE